MFSTGWRYILLNDINLPECFIKDNCQYNGLLSKIIIIRAHASSRSKLINDTNIVNARDQNTTRYDLHHLQQHPRSQITAPTTYHHDQSFSYNPSYPNNFKQDYLQQQQTYSQPVKKPRSHHRSYSFHTVLSDKTNEGKKNLVVGL